MPNDLETCEHERLRLLALAKLTGSVAHKLNNDLTEVTCNLGLVLEDFAAGGVPEDFEDLIKDALAAAEHASRLSREALGLFRLDVSRARPMPLSDYLKHASSFVVDRVLRFAVRHEAAGAQVLSTADYLDTMVAPVVANAEEAAREGEIVLSTRFEHCDEAHQPPEASEQLHTGRYVVIAVRDSGPGMNLEPGQDPFAPFVTSKGRGRGLGLSTALQVARAHGGTMGIRNHPDGGVETAIWIPAVE